MRWFWQQRPARQLAVFRQRFLGRTVIVHRGFPPEWLEALLKQPGGGAHFRVDARLLPSAVPTPIEWFLQTVVLPLNLPLPLLLQVDHGEIRMRHLCRHDRVVHPSEIAWFLEEIESRYHVRLVFGAGPLNVSTEFGIAVSDNDAISMWESFSG